MKSFSFLRIFTPSELKAFMHYVQTPGIGEKQAIMALVRHFYTHRENPDMLNKEKAYRAIFPGEPYNAVKLNNLQSKVRKLIFDFISIQQLIQQPTTRHHLQFQFLLEKNQNEEALKVLARWKREKGKQKLSATEDVFDQYRWHDCQDRVFVSRSERTYSRHLQASNDKLDYFYWLRKLQMACDMASRNLAIQANYVSTQVDWLLSSIQKGAVPFAQKVCIQTYYYAYLMLQEEDGEPGYLKLKPLLPRAASLLSKTETWSLYNYAINFCIRRINSGQASYYKEIHGLYKEVLAKGIILKNGYLTQWDFKNIVTVGLRIRDYEWTENFIEENQHALHPSERLNARAFNLAVLFLEKKQYRDAVFQLNNVRFTDEAYHIGAKIIQLKSYFHLRETEALYASLEAFRLFVKRHRNMSDYRKRANLHFLRLTRQAYQLGLVKELLSAGEWANKFERWHQRLKITEPLANKNWLESVTSPNLYSPKNESK